MNTISQQNNLKQSQNASCITDCFSSLRQSGTHFR